MSKTKCFIYKFRSLITSIIYQIIDKGMSIILWYSDETRNIRRGRRPSWIFSWRGWISEIIDIPESIIWFIRPTKKRKGYLIWSLTDIALSYRRQSTSASFDVTINTQIYSKVYHWTGLMFHVTFDNYLEEFPVPKPFCFVRKEMN